MRRRTALLDHVRSFPSGDLYLESTGTQYIDLGYIPTANTELTIGCDLSINDQSTTALCGVRQGVGDMAYGFWIENDRLRSDYAGETILTDCYDHELTQSTIRRAGPALYVDEALVGTHTAAEVAPNDSLYLFACNTAGSPNGDLIQCRIWLCEIRENGVLVGRYLAKIQGGKAGLYNTVTGKFHRNKGTGEFIIGRR